MFLVCGFILCLVYSKGATYNPFSRRVLLYEAQELCYDMNMGAVRFFGQRSVGPYCILAYSKGATYNPFSRRVLLHEAQESCYDMDRGVVPFFGQMSVWVYSGIFQRGHV